MIALHGAPAFARRAQQVQEALDDLLARCRRQRDEWLALVRIRLGTLRALAGDWDALRPLLPGEEQMILLQELEAELRPVLRLVPEPTRSERSLRRALRELADSLEHFNRRWETYLQGVDVGPVNALRDGYNKFYVIEKECVVRSPRLARQGFRPLPQLTAADLLSLLPPFAVPRLHP
jgi:hypothetical protein